MEDLDTIELDALARWPAHQTLILTVNNRHARRVVAELTSTLTEGRQVMAAPEVVPLSGWVNRLAEQLAFDPNASQPSHTVDAFGAHWLWQRVIGDIESEAGHGLLDVSQAAKLAAEADRLMDDWRIRVPAGQETAEYLHFLTWRDAYRNSLAELDAEDGNMLWERVCGALEDERLDVPIGALVLAGFNELAPRLRAMIAALQRRGIQVVALRNSAIPAGACRWLQVPEPDAEWRLAAAWAARQLSAHPHGRYAIIAARLEEDSALAHRCLREHLAPQTPYNIAVARPLSEWPLARAALAWLRVLARFDRDGFCPVAELGQALLAGGCVANRAERAGRARLDALWRRRGTVSISVQAFGEQLMRHAPQLAAAWQQCWLDLAATSCDGTAHGWRQQFRTCLITLGFPGSGKLDSHAFQSVEAFERLLERMAHLSPVVGVLSGYAASALLRRLADETPFQPQRDPAARLDVLGFLESEGGRWDGVWVLGLTDEVLPAPARPNPFIPLQALRDAGAPRATPERELHWAHTLYEALLKCAPEVWLSHAQYEGERLLRPSPFVAQAARYESGESWMDAVLARAEASFETVPMERILDERGPALVRGARTRGGIGVIDTQARNPLWAFAKYRLGASALPAYADIFDQNARGLLLHKAAELLWRMLRDQAELRAVHESGRLAALLEEVVAQAAKEHLPEYGPRLKELEMHRARNVLMAWVMHELARTPFRVLEVEKHCEWNHGALSLSLRVDRIDALLDDRLVVIDYKSGGGNVEPRADWMRERPVGLQLPFYASVLAGNSDAVAAMALVKLHARGIEARGLQDGDCGMEGMATLDDWPAFAGRSWRDVMLLWRTTINDLAEEYVSGVAINTYLRAEDMRYCDVLPFLRLNEEYPDDTQAAQ